MGILCLPLQVARPKHVNATASEAEMALQMSTYEGEKKAWSCEKYISIHVKYNIILRNLMEHGYQGLNPGSKGLMPVHSSTAVRAHPDKYEKDFDDVVTSLTQYINKRAPTLSVRVASVTQTRPAKQQKTSASCSTLRGRLR